MEEQTPIEEIIEQIRLYKPVYIKLDEEYLSTMIQKEKDFIKAKVLEALEREFKEHLPKFKELVIENNQNEINYHDGDLSVLTYHARSRNKEIEDYYETEVKPKYI